MSRKKNKKHQNGLKKESNFLFADNMILHVESSEDFTKIKLKKIELLNKFSKVTSYKINTQESVVFLHNIEH